MSWHQKHCCFSWEFRKIIAWADRPFKKLHLAHPRMHVRIVHDLSAFAEQVAEADAVIGSRPYLKLSPEVLKPEGRLRWVQTTTAGVDQVVTPDLLAADHVTITCIKGPPGPLMAEHAILLMLALSRNFPVYLKNQERHIWRREGQDWLPLHGHTIAILGVGSSGVTRLSTISGIARILAISLEILSTISFGVPAGANSPVQPVISNAGRPASAKVGACGKGGARIFPEIARGLSLPLVI